jgi:ribosomal protein L11 methyltransferase
MIRLAVRVAGADAEIVLAELLELAPGGVEEVALEEGLVEYAVYGSPGELPALPDLRAAVGTALVEVCSREVADDWEERWKQFHKPVLIDSPAPGLVPAVYVRPPWEAEAAEGGAAEAVEIVLDPGQAFGTGGHASTQLCLGLLLELVASEPGEGPLLDVGTGSGVLAIAAAKLGYGPVIGLDHDRESVRAAGENARVNDVSIDVRRRDLRADPLPLTGEDRGGVSGSSREWERRPVVVANLLRPLLLDLARAIPSAPSHLLAGGLLVGEVDEIVGAYAERHGMYERDRRQSGEWAAVWLRAGS